MPIHQKDLRWKTAAACPVARDFPTQKALTDYMHDHPEADKSKHHVEKPDDKPAFQEAWETKKDAPKKPEPKTPELDKLEKNREKDPDKIKKKIEEMEAKGQSTKDYIRGLIATNDPWKADFGR